MHREGKIRVQEYNIGKPMYDEKVGETDKRGTIITFTPDATIFLPKPRNTVMILGLKVEGAFFPEQRHQINPDR